MNTKQRYSSATLRRVQQFLDTNADALGGINQSALRAELDAALAESEGMSSEQGTRVRATRGESNNQRQLEKALKKEHVTPMVKVARAQLKGVPNFAALTPSVQKLRGDRLVKAATALATAAEPYAMQFEMAHFPANFLTELRDATVALKTSLDTRSQHNVSFAGATRQMKQSIAHGHKAVATLDAALTRTLLANPRLESEWKAAKRIANKPGKARAAGTIGAIAPAVTPTITAVGTEMRAAA